MSAAQSLATGPAGAALLAVELGEDPRAWLVQMTAAPIMAHPDEATLFEGAPAIAFTLAATAPHAPALSTLDDHLQAIIRARLEAAKDRERRGVLPNKREYDLISGLTGLGAYLLRRHGGGELLREVLAYLVRLSEPRADGLPGWWATGGPTPGGTGWEGGHANLGIAHGICGPLALLALAARRSVVVDGHTAAMRRICTWLDYWRRGASPRNWWPEAIRRTDHERGTTSGSGPHRPSWCYGTPGIAYAQLLAGIALDDVHRQRIALDALSWCLTDGTQLVHLSDASLCHGWAGAAYIAWRSSTHDDRIAAALPRLLDGLVTALADQPPPGLLVGETGARLVQHAVSGTASPITQWDACLLLNH